MAKNFRNKKPEQQCAKDFFCCCHKRKWIFNLFKSFYFRSEKNQVNRRKKCVVYIVHVVLIFSNKSQRFPAHSNWLLKIRFKLCKKLNKTNVRKTNIRPYLKTSSRDSSFGWKKTMKKIIEFLQCAIKVLNIFMSFS